MKSIEDLLKIQRTAKEGYQSTDFVNEGRGGKATDEDIYEYIHTACGIDDRATV